MPDGYDERLGVPLRWWALATMFLATILLAFLVATPLWVACAVTGTLVALTVVVFTSYGAARLSVHDGVLTAGRAHIKAAHLGEVTVLDADAARMLAGRDADARAYLLLRPYLRRAVRVDITDPADPAPYWLMSSRHPEWLAGAVREAQTGSTGSAVG